MKVFSKVNTITGYTVTNGDEIVWFVTLSCKLVLIFRVAFFYQMENVVTGTYKT